MQAYNTLQAKLMAHTKRHQDLETIFQQLRIHAHNYLSGNSQLFPSLAICDFDDLSLIAYHVCGRKVLFKLATPAIENGALRGLITYYLQNEFPANELVKINCVELKLTGEIDINDEYGDPINIAESRGAEIFVISSILDALSK